MRHDKLPAMRFLLGALFSISIAAEAAFPVVSGRNPAQRADTIYEMIGKELIYTEKTADKFKSIQAGTQDLKRLLNADDSMTPEMRDHIETYISALKSLPPKKGFHKSDCVNYQVDEKAKPLLDGLCQ